MRKQQRYFNGNSELGQYTSTDKNNSRRLELQSSVRYNARAKSHSACASATTDNRGNTALLITFRFKLVNKEKLLSDGLFIYT